MSMEFVGQFSVAKRNTVNDLNSSQSLAIGGVSTLTPLGKHIEMLRIERGLSKQLLARRAGSSRQQLWRVMTGKSELTTTLCTRLAAALQVAPAGLSAMPAPLLVTPPSATSGVPATKETSFAEYFADVNSIERTVQTLPGGADGTSLKRAFLNELERTAIAASLVPSSRFLALRRRVLNGEI